MCVGRVWRAVGMAFLLTCMQAVIEMSPDELLEFAMETMEKNGRGKNRIPKLKKKANES